MIRLKARHVRNLVPGPPVLIAGTTGQRIRLQSKGSDVESARLGSICAFSSAIFCSAVAIVATATDSERRTRPRIARYLGDSPFRVLAPPQTMPLRFLGDRPNTSSTGRSEDASDA